MSAILDAQPVHLHDGPERGTGVEKPPSTISTAPAVWPVRPARRQDPSAPTWDDAADTDTDPDDRGGG